MSDGISYYMLLGISEKASIDEIKRAYGRKRREFLNDEETSMQLNAAYDILCDSEKRKQYDVDLIYGSEKEKILENINNSSSEEERNKYLEAAKGLYLNVLKLDPKNLDAFKNLFDFEEMLDNRQEALTYLPRIEKCIVNIKDETEKMQWWHWLGEKYKEYDQVDNAILVYQKIYKADVTYCDDVITLTRLYYENKKDIGMAIGVINDAINRSEQNKYKVRYLCEYLRAVRLSKEPSYSVLEEAIYKRLKSFYSENKEENLTNAAGIMFVMGDILDRRDWNTFHHLEEIVLSYKVDNDSFNLMFKSIQQMAREVKANKVHEVIILWLEDERTKEMRHKIGEYLLLDIKSIKLNLEYLKKKIPLYWDITTELHMLEAFIDRQMISIKEYQSLENDYSISNNMKKILRILLLDEIINYDDIKIEYETARNTFFRKDNLDLVRSTIKRMGDFYPNCYRLFSETFFEGKSVAEVLSGQGNTETERIQTANYESSEKITHYPNAEDGYECKPYISGFEEAIVLFIVFIFIPAVIPFVFVFKLYVRHKKSIVRAWEILTQMPITKVLVWILNIVEKFTSAIEETKVWKIIQQVVIFIVICAFLFF